MPAVTLDELYTDAVQYIADGSDDENHRHQMVVRKRFARILDGVTEARGYAKELGRHEYDPRNTEGEADAGQHVERDRRNDYLCQHVPGTRAKIARHLEPRGIDLRESGGGGECHGPNRRNRNEKDDRLVPPGEHNYRDRLPRERADHAQQLERRVAQFAKRPATTHKDADRHADGDGDEQPGAHAITAGPNRALDPPALPQRCDRAECRRGPEVGKMRHPRVDRDNVDSDPPKNEQDREARKKVEQALPRRHHEALGSADLSGCGDRAHRSTISIISIFLFQHSLPPRWCQL